MLHHCLNLGWKEIKLKKMKNKFIFLLLGLFAVQNTYSWDRKDVLFYCRDIARNTAFFGWLATVSLLGVVVQRKVLAHQGIMQNVGGAGVSLLAAGGMTSFNFYGRNDLLSYASVCCGGFTVACGVTILDLLREQMVCSA